MDLQNIELNKTDKEEQTDKAIVRKQDTMTLFGSSRKLKGKYLNLDWESNRYLLSAKDGLKSNRLKTSYLPPEFHPMG